MPRNILVVGLGEKCLNLTAEGGLTVGALKLRLSSIECVNPSSFFLARSGAPLEDSDVLDDEDYGTTFISAYPVIKGGKGGFGSLIRAMGTQINKSTNKEACRDLTGRRVRDVNAEKKITQWLKKEPERKKKVAEERRKRLEKRRAEPRHTFDDHTYMQQIKDTEENMDSALKQGLEAASSSKTVKRKLTVPETTSKKPKLWLGIDEAELESGSSSEEEEEEEEEWEEDEGEGNKGKQPIVLGSAGSSDESSGSPKSAEMLDRPGPSGLQVTPPAEKKKTSPKQLSRTLESSSEQSSVNEAGTEAEPTEVDESKDSEVSETGTDREDVCSVTKAERQQEAQSEGDTERERDLDDQKSGTSNQQDKEETSNEAINLEVYGSSEELESVGPERLKVVLQAMGLKCGGTLQERAQRLFATKGKRLEELDPSLFAKTGKQRKRKHK